MSLSSLLREVLCLQDTVVESFSLTAGAVLVNVRPRSRMQNRCSRCQRRCRYYDAGTKERRWRSLFLGCYPVYLVADTYRVRCPEHGVVVAHVPWARPRARLARAFDHLVAWMATKCSKSAVSEYTGIAWRSVGRAIERVVESQASPLDRIENLRHIGIDEISYRRHHRYLTVVIDHDSGQLIWAAEGRNKAVVHRFFDELGEERCRAIEAVTRDAATWISSVVDERCPNAVQCMDPFHVIQWATNALDAARREAVATLRRWNHEARAQLLNDTYWVIRKNPENLTEFQQRRLRRLRATRDPLFRAYQLKEDLRAVFQVPYETAVARLEAWLTFARRSQIEPFVKLAKSVHRQKEAIHHTLRHQLSNGRVEAMNNAIRLIARRAYGFHSPDALISLAMLSHGGLKPALPRPSNA